MPGFAYNLHRDSMWTIEFAILYIITLSSQLPYDAAATLINGEHGILCSVGNVDTRCALSGCRDHKSR